LAEAERATKKPKAKTKRIEFTPSKPMLGEVMRRQHRRNLQWLHDLVALAP
jgi:hypothetical protein